MPPKLQASTLERSIPAVIAILTLAGLVTDLAVYSHEAPRSAYLARVWGSLLSFAGTYLPLEGQSASPTPWMSAGGLLSLGATLVAAATAVAAMSQNLRDYLRVRRTTAELVIIGGTTAAHLVRSQLAHQTKRTLLITDDRPALRAAAALAGAAVMERDIAALAVDEDAISLCRRSAKVAITTNADATNLIIARKLIGAPGALGPKVMALISDSLLVDELRPAVIDGPLTLRFGLTSPSENVGERIGLKLDDLLLADARLHAAHKVTISVDGDDGLMANGVTRVLVRYQWSRSFLVDADERAFPAVEVDPHATSPSADILIVVREDSAEAAAVALKAARRRASAPQIVLAVTDPALLESWPAGLVIDPVADGWDSSLMFDDMADQMARSYHYAYSVMFKGVTYTEPLDAWNPHDRFGESSYGAVTDMLAVLKRNGFCLRKTDDVKPGRPSFSSAEIAIMARAEHESWRDRTWGPDGARVAEGRAADVSWDDLPDSVRALNERVPTQTYPALAALFGYEIVRR